MSYWICDKDQNCIDCPKHYPEETCEHYIEVETVKDTHTNADCIRAMTDEELAEWIFKHDCHTNLYGYDRIEAVLDWLKQEVKG